jgi:hypothetical protein
MILIRFFLYFQVDRGLICINIVSTFHITVIIYIYENIEKPSNLKLFSSFLYV